jgi:hypothetical protein
MQQRTGENCMSTLSPRPLSGQEPKAHVALTPHLRLAIQAFPDHRPGARGWLRVYYERRSGSSVDPAEWQRSGSEVRLREDRIQQFFDALEHVSDAAIARGMWTPFGDAAA